MIKEPYHEVRAQIALTKIANGQVPSEFCSERDPNVPSSAASLELWAQANPAFAARLLDAKRMGAQAMVADCVRIAADRAYRVDERKAMIDARKYLAALWNAECNPKTVIEQNTTVRNVTPREQYVADCVLFLGMDRQQAGAKFDREQGVTVQ